jgi:hypothetical protein
VKDFLSGGTRRFSKLLSRTKKSRLLCTVFVTFSSPAQLCDVNARVRDVFRLVPDGIRQRLRLITNLTLQKTLIFFQIHKPPPSPRKPIPVAPLPVRVAASIPLTCLALVCINAASSLVRFRAAVGRFDYVLRVARTIFYRTIECIPRKNCLHRFGRAVISYEIVFVFYNVYIFSASNATPQFVSLRTTRTGSYYG